ncbi:hypothetical protein VTJ83DRAFT_1346 [Remersonia thermophila]|uniref:Uncharacterized protein n=1 Tax=Remersonia thermophila TaxID=72144 RepID=A0ABR4DNY8_9PEZI
MRILKTLALAASTAWVAVSGQSCNPVNATFSTAAMPAGQFQPFEMLNPVVEKTSRRYFVTIVNLTPHLFKLESVDGSKMDEFSFGDVPPGRARQNPLKYRFKILVADDKTTATYAVQGANNKQFAVRATRKLAGGHDVRRVTLDLSGMGLGSREYAFPGGQASVTLVVTGSESYGFRSSLRHGPGNWMSSIKDVIRDRPVRHLILPGTHDAGMSTITHKIASIGSKPNTQNQALNIHDQLRAGSRWFDLRIASIHPDLERDATKHDGFWVLHVNDETADVAVGNTGEPLDQVIDEVNRFTSQHPGEIIFFSIRYLVGRHRHPTRGPILWTQPVVDQFFAKLRGVNNRCPSLDAANNATFQNYRAGYLMDQNDGRGCVLLLLNGRLPDGVTHESPADGIYALSRLALRDRWSNKMHARDVAADQVAAWRSLARGGPGDHDGFLISQWLVTPDAVAATVYSLESFAVEQANPALYFHGVNGMDPARWPNVILVDYIGVLTRNEWARDQLGAELYTLALGLNLYLVSENCHIQKGTPPLIDGL